MAGDAGGQDLVQVFDRAAGEAHRHLAGPEQGLLVLDGALDALREAVQAPGDDQGGDVVEEEVVEALAALGLAEPAQIGDLRLADDLEAAGVEVVIEALELEAGPVQVRHGQHGRAEIAPLVQHLQVEEGHEILHFQTILTHGVSPFPGGAAPLRAILRSRVLRASIPIIYEVSPTRNTFRKKMDGDLAKKLRTF